MLPAPSLTAPERPLRWRVRRLAALLMASLGLLFLAWGLTHPGAPGQPRPGFPPLGGAALGFPLAILLWPRAGGRNAGLSPAPASRSVAPRTVLVVDDEPILRDLARIALERGGFRVLEARDGQEAVELFQAGQETVDLILLDLTMPRMDGAEAFRQIRSLAPEVRVLVTSGYTQAESLDLLADLPPDGFLQKPFRVQQLLDRAQGILAAEG